MDLQALSPEIIQDTQNPPSTTTTTTPSTSSIPPSEIDSTFKSTYIDLLSAHLPTTHLSTSNSFFAPSTSLNSPHPPISRPGVYISTGAWYDGWETRRHNPKAYDWVIFRVGVASGVVRGVEIDTAFFNGNQAPEVSVEGCFVEAAEGEEGKADERVVGMAEEEEEGGEGGGWRCVMGRRACGPNRRHAWRVGGGNTNANATTGEGAKEEAITHVRLRMYPDGGIARFRLYGVAVPVWPGAQPDGSEPEVELSAAAMGGVATECSDEHFGAKENLLWPGRGKDMGDGWETRRSRERGHVDWVVVRLGARGKVSRLVVDTAHFRGNYPQAVRVEATDAEEEGGLGWVPVLAEQKLGPDAEHEFGGEVLQHTERAYTHFRMLILPDGGVKRFRVFGTRV